MTDLGSTNGTYLDEEELPPNRAADIYVGSKIVFGELLQLPITYMLLFAPLHGDGRKNCTEQVVYAALTMQECACCVALEYSHLCVLLQAIHHWLCLSWWTGRMM